MSKKERIPLWMYPETIQKADSMFEADNCRSRSEFMEKAVRFYMDYLNMRDSANLLPEFVLSAIDGTLDLSEMRITRIIFKLAVEIAINNRLMAGYGKVPAETLRQLRAKAIEDVKHTYGTFLL